MIEDQHRRRLANHSHSERSKAHGRPSLPRVDVETGDLVFMYCDGNKNSPRPRYIVTGFEGDWIIVKKTSWGALL